MSASFYPNLGGGGGGGSNIDYDKIKNKPIIDLNGTEDVPDIISALDYGNYLVKGWFKFDSNQAEPQTFDTPTNLYVSKDGVTGKKTFSYAITKNGMPYMVIGTYDEEGNLEQYEEVPLGSPRWGSF